MTSRKIWEISTRRICFHAQNTNCRRNRCYKIQNCFCVAAEIFSFGKTPSFLKTVERFQICFVGFLVSRESCLFFPHLTCVPNSTIYASSFSIVNDLSPPPLASSGVRRRYNKSSSKFTATSRATKNNNKNKEKLP